MVKDWEDWHGLQITKLKSLAKLLKPFNRDIATLNLTYEHYYHYHYGLTRRLTSFLLVVYLHSESVLCLVSDFHDHNSSRELTKSCVFKS